MANLLFQTSPSQKTSNLWNTDNALADEGSFYLATNPTTGTAIATTTSVVDDAATASATHAQNVPVMIISNPSNNTRSIYPRYLRMLVAQAPTSATYWNFAFRADNVARYTSGGSLITPVNINTGVSSSSSAQIYFGAVVTTNLPSASARLLDAGSVTGGIPTAKDQWIFTFGDVSAPTNLLQAAANKNSTIPCGPIVIAPGWNLVLEMWGASNAAAPSWEFTLGYAERISGQ